MPHKSSQIFLQNVKTNIFMYSTQKEAGSLSEYQPENFFSSVRKQTCSSKPSNMSVARNFIRILISVLALEMSERELFFFPFLPPPSG